ncbi:MAG: DUF2254 domain-containing protein [Chloroflexota bacterium]|nr:DUF2254 domain-containing protein [Chloroflexota bacterium]
MQAQMFKLWKTARSSLWFMPSILVGIGIALAFALVALEGSAGTRLLQRMPIAFGAGPDGARGMLQTIAGSVLGLAGIAFSSTLVVLSLSASTYTPRVLRNFTSDLGNQIVLGTLLSTFVYALLVLRTIRNGENGGEGFVPTLAVTFAVLIAVLDLAVFIYFVHHIAQSIQVSTITAGVAKETKARIGDLFPQHLGKGPDEVDEPHEPRDRLVGARVPAPQAGYLLLVDEDDLMDLTTEHDLTLRLERRIGEFVPEGATLAMVAPRERMDTELVAKIQQTCALGQQRTLSQDVEFGMRQLVDIALKALSPGINDVTTATTCLDHLGDILRQLAPRAMPPRHRYDERGALRVIAPGPTFDGLMGLAFDQIRTAGRAQAAVLLRMLAILEDLASVSESPSRRRTLLLHAKLLGKAAERGLPDERDQGRISAELETVLRSLLVGGETTP